MSGRMWMAVAVLVLAGGLFVQAAAADAIEVSGGVSEVTVYRGQALVSRTISANPPAGLSELIVTDLPERIVPTSLFATAPGGVSVRAVRYRQYAVKNEPREEVRKLDDEIKAKARELAGIEVQKSVVEGGDEYLDKLSGFIAPTSQVELTKGVLNAETLKKLTEFVLEARAEKAEEFLKLNLAAQDVTEEINLLKRKRAELAADADRTAREAVLFVDADAAGAATITLSYLVTGAGWEPSYSLKAASGSDEVQIEYNASIYQVSGEDWDGVELTLSTASPAMMADGPELAPFWVTLSAAAPEQMKGRAEAAERYQQLLGANMAFSQRQIASANESESRDRNWDMLLNSNDLQALEALGSLDVDDYQRAAEAGAGFEAMSVTYHLPGAASLESRADRQLVRIADLSLGADFYYVANPIMTEYVYRRAELANESEFSLLAGPASVYRDGEFVGNSALPMVAEGQKFSIGLGLDGQLRTSRELVDRTEETMGANREIAFKYSLALENYMDEPVVVRLYDRLPHPIGDADIRVTEGEMSHDLSDDELYVEAERTKGILRWDVEVEGRSSGADAKKVDYEYKVEFARALAMTTPVSGSGNKSDGGRFYEEFRSIQQNRRKAH